jgi:hypothetical protein
MLRGQLVRQGPNTGAQPGCKMRLGQDTGHTAPFELIILLSCIDTI